MYRTASSKITLVFDNPNIINAESPITEPGQRKKPVSILSDEFCECSPKGKVGYNAPRDIPASPAQYFNQRLLNFNQDFASDVSYIYFARSA